MAQHIAQIIYDLYFKISMKGYLAAYVTVPKSRDPGGRCLDQHICELGYLGALVSYIDSMNICTYIIFLCPGEYIDSPVTYPFRLKYD